MSCTCLKSSSFVNRRTRELGRVRIRKAQTLPPFSIITLLSLSETLSEEEEGMDSDIEESLKKRQRKTPFLGDPSSRKNFMQEEDIRLEATRARWILTR
ncbi:hypothetical protein CFP56_026798 [Quercus suber]|uniref:Uncharacterized protein n=1 Tax=Quercus suber TaxID=58331 RepID=A0AAW0JZJ2_QUESU